MAFDDDEDAGGDPVHLYALTGTGSLAWYLTSDNVSHTYGGHTYDPIQVAASDLVSVSTLDPEALVVRIPGTHEVCLRYGFGSPPQNLSLTVYRKQTGGDVRQIWSGTVPNVAAEGDWCELRCPSILGDRLEVEAPGWRHQSQCNNVLYDDICRVPKTGANVASTTVASITGDGSTIVVASVGAAADQWFRGGSVIRTADGESRLIVDQVGTTLRLHAPFYVISVSNAVTLEAGCDRAAGTCRDKFANIANFTGAPFVPIERVLFGWGGRLRP